MADFPEFLYTKRDVRRAGEVLRGDIIWEDESAEEIKEIFRIANNWRDSHAYPMRRIRYELIGQIRRLDQPGKTWARLKRMHSVRRKLQNLPENLTQLQDLGGCRAVMPTINDAKLLVNSCRENLRHTVHRVDDYINKPKRDGYRCYHVVYKFAADEQDAAFDGRRIEIQIRSRMQHSWATAVEGVGTYRNDDFKGGGGDPEWRRLFELTASEIAIAEGCPELDGAPTRDMRVKEIKELNKKLQVQNTLENLRQAFNYVENYLSNTDPKYFLIRYNKMDATVSVDPYDTSYAGTKSLDSFERDEHVNSVLVEADKIETLVEGYPNYFGDVRLFKQTLANIVQGNEPEYILPPQEMAPSKPKEVPDLSWFKRRKRWT